MADAEQTQSRVSVSARLRTLIRERPRLTITLNVDRLRTLLLFLGFEALIGFCSYAYFWLTIPGSLHGPNYVEAFGTEFYSAPEFVIPIVVVGACVFWLVRLLLFSKTARWLTSLVIAYFCLIGQNYLVASILFSTALVLMAIGDIKSSND